MKSFFKYLLIVISIFCITQTWGCKKRAQSKLIGAWDMFFYDKTDAPYSAYASDGRIKSIIFSFESGNRVFRSMVVTKTDGSNITVVDTGEYVLQTKKLRTHIKITKFKDQIGNDGDNGLWWIDKLDSKILAIQRVELSDLGGGPYLRYEFQKK